MSDTLPVNTLAGRGHNSGTAPLAEVLAEELDGDKARADELIEAASTAQIKTSGDAAAVTDLIALIRDHERAIDRAREVRKRPFLYRCRVIDTVFGGVTGPLARARLDTLSPMLTEWQKAHADKPIATSIASVGSRREITFCIEDLPAAVGWLMRERPGEMAQAARTILGTVLRSIGVDMAADTNIPGVRVEVVTKAQVR